MRVTLDKKTIASKALELLAEGGLRRLSTRKLAERCGIKNASLYHYFQDKSELLDYVADGVVRPAWRAPHPGEDWRDWLYEIGVAVRRQLLLYPDGALVAAGAWPRPELAGDAVALLYQPLVAAGFPRETARYVILTVLRFAVGWAADEQVAAARGAARGPGDEGYGFGLRSIIRGVEGEASVSGLAGRPHAEAPIGEDEQARDRPGRHSLAQPPDRPPDDALAGADSSPATVSPR